MFVDQVEKLLNGTSFLESEIEELQLAKELKLLENSTKREHNWKKFSQTFWIIFSVYVIAAFVWLLFSVYHHRHQKNICKQKQSEYSLTQMLERQRLLHLYNNISSESNCTQKDETSTTNA
ncbi:hypothetical protein QR680_001580 [Steinernema hermaphroditum]|uniref:Uncharacterized protein n=1 Tax=Steinernema hermaphroditum TaxID=289476 RepID=A0AA39GZ09_9BILA|nr:hypothetical protein QR680_001580 [Steinernema hermaphroditum]